MAGKHDNARVARLETPSTHRHKLVGPAVVDGPLIPVEAELLPVAAHPAYSQGTGNYAKQGGDHKQRNRDHNQSLATARISDQVINVVRDPAIIRDASISGGP
jgi:hypothetical protein